MFDPISQGLAAVSSGSPFAAPLVFAAGAASSVGPCVAPRFIAIAGLTAGQSRARAAALVGAFICGLCLVYASFGVVSSLLARAAQFSSWTYWTVAFALLVGGCITLWREDTHCDHAHASDRKSGIGAAFLLGGSFALVVSPCCTPLVIGIVTYASAAGNPAYASILLACFGLGHALPIAFAALGSSGATTVLTRLSARQAGSVVSATLMLGLAAYYAVLA